MNKLFTIFRCVYAAYFLFAISILLNLMNQDPESATRIMDQPPAAQDFFKALIDTDFVIPLLILNYLIGGLALIFDRTAPLGIVLLAPAVTIIFFFHLMLSGMLVWGGISFAYFLILAWCYRGRFRGLWSYSG